MTKKSIIIDLEGVLLNIDYKRTFKKFSEHGVELKYTDDFKLLVSQYDQGLITTNTVYENICKSLTSGQSLSFEQFVNAWNAMLLYIPEQRLEYLFNLKQQGHVIVLLSNINELHAENVHSTYGALFNKLFDAIFYSYQTHLLKPDPKIFFAVIEYLKTNNIELDEILFVDDSAENIATATQQRILSRKYPLNGCEHGKPIYLRSLIEDHAPILFKIQASKSVAVSQITRLEKLQCLPKLSSNS